MGALFGVSTRLELPRVPALRTLVSAQVCGRDIAADLWAAGGVRNGGYEPRPATRKVARPSHDQLKADLAHMSYVAVGRKYGVSDNAVRKWLRLV
jgi:hypothetical protein